MRLLCKTIAVFCVLCLMNDGFASVCSAGTVYTRWGRKACPSTASLVYEGLAGGRWYSETGGGSSYLCLPHVPEYGSYDKSVSAYRGYVYSAEYRTNAFTPLQSVFNHDVPCALCYVYYRQEHLMIPAKMTCPSGWTKEYQGYLMTGLHNDKSDSEYVCVDGNPDIVAGSDANQDGARFYPVESRCDKGNLPCSPYINGAELTCVVCSK